MSVGGAVSSAPDVLSKSVTSTADWLNHVGTLPLGQAAGALLLAWVVYYLGLKTYFRQKQAEVARSRVVDSGIELFAAQLDGLLSTQRHNWQLTLRYLKLLRDAPDAVSADDFYRSIREVDPDTFHVVCAHRVTELTGERVFWIGYQKVYSFVSLGTDFLAGDFGALVRTLSSNPERVDRQAAIAAAFQKAEELDNDVTQYYVFLSEVAELASLATRHVTDRRSAERFSRRQDVRAVIERVKNQSREWSDGDAVHH